MNRVRQWGAWVVIGGLILVGIWNLPRGEEPSAPHSETRLLMGTLVSIAIWGLDEKSASLAMDGAFNEMGRIESVMSRFLPESAVSQVNGSPRGRFHLLPEEVLIVVSRGLEFGRMSNGAFDIGIGPLSDLWGFSREPPPERAPDPTALESWLKLRSETRGAGIDLMVEDRTIRLANESVGLDLGGIAKGYAVDRAMEQLHKAGVVNALINAGGDMRIAGSKGSKPWHIGLRDPRKPDGVVAVMDIDRARAISTSGDYERFFLADGVRHHHILDPKSAAPARSGLMSVSIQANDSLTADALSTALFVLGERAGLELLHRFPGCEALLIRADGSQLQTPGFIASRIAAP